MIEIPIKKGLIYRFLAISVVLHLAAAVGLWLYRAGQPTLSSPPRQIQITLKTRAPQKTLPPPQSVQETQPLPPPVKEDPLPVTQPEPVEPPPPLQPKPKSKPTPPTLPKPLPKPQPQPQPQPQSQPKTASSPPVVVPVQEQQNPVVAETRLTTPLPNQPALPVASVPVISPVVKVEAEDNWQEEYGLRVRQLIQKNKRYPLMARRAGMEGIVELDFKIARSGQLLEVVVNRSSGYAILDQAAMQAVQNVGKFPPLSERTPAPELELKLPISFRLRQMR